MKKQIEEIKTEKGIVIRITTEDERFYCRVGKNPITGLPEIMQFVPSVTWISGFYPKGIAFYKWLAQKGWDEAEALKTAAGDKGSKIHLAIADLLGVDEKTKKPNEVKIDSKYLNKSTGQAEELTPDEYEAIISFKNWYEEEQPKEILGSEFVVFGDGYAGTIDILYRKQDGRLVVLDVKSGQNIWPEYELQISAYVKALFMGEPIKGTVAGEPIMRELLQVGYKRNKSKFKVTEVPDRYDLFLSAKNIWSHETEGIQPLQRDFPLSISLAELLKDESTVSILEPVAEGVKKIRKLKPNE